MTDINNCFRTASKEVLQYLRGRFGFGLWMVTRTRDVDWVVLHAEDHGYGVRSGDVFRWTDSFCSRMVRNEGPRIAPNSIRIDAYREAPIATQVPIGAYIGMPLNRANGDLFGTLCAIDPAPQPEDLLHEQTQIELFSHLLETILECECKADDESRRAERAEAQAMSDHLTGLFNRRGWDALLAHEESRCQQFSHPAAILSIDLDELKLVNDTQGHNTGDGLIQEAARVLQQNVRTRDIVARVGGDEFLILAVECEEYGAPIMVDRISNVLNSHGIAASIGFGIRRSKGSMHAASIEADEAMYKAKRGKRNRRARS